MAKTEQIQVRINPEVKQSAEAVFARLGVNPSEAVRMFYHQVTLQQGLPFEVRIPNSETVEALKTPLDEKGSVRHTSMESFVDSIENL